MTLKLTRVEIPWLETAPVFRIKICGVTSVVDAAAVARSEADALGLNFYPGSKRCVSEAVARRIVDAVGGELLCIGVFVNAAATEIRSIAERVGLAAIQLHGDEPATRVAELAEFPVVRARRVDALGIAAVAADCKACLEAGRAPEAVLIDAPAPGEYGGTGRQIDWKSVAGYRDHLGDTPLILAGGLKPENVADAICMVRPTGVDVASGVERSPGQKDPAAVAAFASAAAKALLKSSAS